LGRPSSRPQRNESEREYKKRKRESELYGTARSCFYSARRARFGLAAPCLRSLVHPERTPRANRTEPDGLHPFFLGVRVPVRSLGRVGHSFPNASSSATRYARDSKIYLRELSAAEKCRRAKGRTRPPPPRPPSAAAPALAVVVCTLLMPSPSPARCAAWRRVRS
jgi:hypothetical protein